jgi:hypothetical protein
VDLYSNPWPSTALTAATARTLVQLVTPATARAKWVDFAISFDGATSTAVPVLVEVLLQTTAGTATTGVAPVAINAQQPAALCTYSHTVTVEPTASTILFRTFVHPQGGMFTFQWPLGREPVMAVSTRMGIRATAPAGVNCAGWLTHEE